MTTDTEKRLADSRSAIMEECRVVDGMRAHAGLMTGQPKGYMLDGATQIERLKKLVIELTTERDAAWVGGAKAMKKRALDAMEDCVISVSAKGVGVSEACEIVNAVEQQLTAAIRALSSSTLNKPK